MVNRMEIPAGNGCADHAEMRNKATAANAKGRTADLQGHAEVKDLPKIDSFYPGLTAFNQRRVIGGAQARWLVVRE